MRLDTLVKAGGIFGVLARVRLAVEVALLFDEDPAWTTTKILPLFDWSSGEALWAWSARRYARYIGSPKLFELTKVPFLAMFSRPDVPSENLRTYSDWLAVIMLSNQSGGGYPIEAIEARSALRRAGEVGLSSVAHTLSTEMGRAKPEEKLECWRTRVGAVFEAIWPLDLELQSAKSTFPLVHILRASGNAFPEAVDTILPFVRPDDVHVHSTVFAISGADKILYSSAPEKVLDLLAAVVGDAPAASIYGLGEALKRIEAVAPDLSRTRKFQELAGQASSD